MVKVSVLFPFADGVRFDMDYYVDTHMPMVRELLGSACKGVAVEEGLAGTGPDANPVFVAMGHLYFDSAESFEDAFGPHAEQIMGDVPNYTDARPAIQVSDVRI